MGTSIHMSCSALSERIRKSAFIVILNIDTHGIKYAMKTQEEMVFLHLREKHLNRKRVFQTKLIKCYEKEKFLINFK